MVLGRGCCLFPQHGGMGARLEGKVYFYFIFFFGGQGLAVVWGKVGTGCQGGVGQRGVGMGEGRQGQQCLLQEQVDPLGSS